MPSSYQPPLRLDTAAYLLAPTRTVRNGVACKEYPKSGLPFSCEFKTFGGTESAENGVVSVVKTATVKCWFDPRITAGCRIEVAGGKVYEVLGDPEDVDNRHQHMRFRVERVSGGA